jgi:hypothetical protein
MTEAEAWKWLNRMVEPICDESAEDLGYSASMMVDAYMAGHRAALDATPPETLDERQAAIVAALRDDAQRCDCFALSEGECACGAWDAEPGERSYKRKGVEDIADWIESGEWRR